MTAGSALVAEAHAVKLTGVTHQSFIWGAKLTTSNRPGSLHMRWVYLPFSTVILKEEGKGMGISRKKY